MKKTLKRIFFEAKLVDWKVIKLAYQNKFKIDSEITRAPGGAWGEISGFDIFIKAEWSVPFIVIQVVENHIKTESLQAFVKDFKWKVSPKSNTKEIVFKLPWKINDEIVANLGKVVGFLKEHGIQNPKTESRKTYELSEDEYVFLRSYRYVWFIKLVVLCSLYVYLINIISYKRFSFNSEMYAFLISSITTVLLVCFSKWNLKVRKIFGLFEPKTNLLELDLYKYFSVMLLFNVVFYACLLI